MFEAAEVGRTVTKDEYDREVAALRERLLDMQTALRAADFPLIIVIGGVDGAGKGETVNTLLERRSRFVETFALGALSDEERKRPPYYRFWKALPPKGKIGIFFGGWHSGPIVERAGRLIRRDEFERRLNETWWPSNGNLPTTARYCSSFGCTCRRSAAQATAQPRKRQTATLAGDADRLGPF